MNREDRFVQSHQPYAVDLASFTPRGRPGGHGQARIDAVWFRRRRSGWNGPLLTVACAGYISECLIPDPQPATAGDFLARLTDGRYGGHCQARWDGFNLWAPEMGEDERGNYLALLGPMLRHFPAVPDGWDGWWTFRG